MGPGILIIVYKGIGDVLLTTPLLRALKKGIPDSRLFFLTRRPSRKVLENNPRLAGVFCREDKPLRAIRAAGIDISLDFMRSSSSAFYSILSGATKRLAFKYPGGRLFYNLMADRGGDGGYTVYDRLRLLGPLGIPHDGPEMELSFTPGNAAKADGFLAYSGVKPGDFLVTMDITSPREHRRWAPEKFAGLADFLSSEFGARVVFLWGPGELEFVKAAAKLANRDHLVSPELDLLDLAALQKRASLHVGNSSAPMHLAVSQGVPTFTLYAQQDSPRSWSPPGPRHAWAQGELATLSFETVRGRLGAHAALIRERRP